MESYEHSLNDLIYKLNNFLIFIGHVCRYVFFTEVMSNESNITAGQRACFRYGRVRSPNEISAIYLTTYKYTSVISHIITR